MNRDDFVTIYRYHTWAWDRVLAQAARVTADQYIALAPVPHGSLRGTLVHALSAEIVWRTRFQGESPTTTLQEADLPTFAGLRTRWAVEAQEMQACVAGLADAQINTTLSYKTTKGVPQTDMLWHLLLHVLNHGTQHRSEAAMLLTTYSLSPGDLDVITFLRGRREVSAAPDPSAGAVS